MLELYLIRHGQSTNNANLESQRVEDPDLTDLGKLQALRLAASLAELELDRIVTSPFRRTLETTAACISTTSLTPEVWVDLHEQGGCYAGYPPGPLTGRPGMSRAEIEGSFPTYHVPEQEVVDASGWWKSRPYESSVDATQRASRLWQRTRRELLGRVRRVAFIMHADFQQLFLSQMNARELHVPWNTSLTRLRVTAEDACLLEYNTVRHLPSHLHTW